jgi:hypothetical protein
MADKEKILDNDDGERLVHFNLLEIRSQILDNDPNLT